MNHFGLEYFSRIYRDSKDPWNFEESWYERRKYALTLASLPRERYARAFEPGCSIGVLSELLAPRCDALVCYELVTSVADRARERLKKYPNASVDVRAIPDDWPDGELDLVLFSEVVYYLDSDGVDAVAKNVERTLVAGGHVVAVHYLKETDYPLSGDAAHAELERRMTGMARLGSYVEPSFRLDVFERSA
ncbi:MAG TPA: SAM-dependent methyltransferase [Polyangiaceae bacterium]|jgi:protein-L-isoaspartate O-methyltransferase|nr:SAM-dependent methyltransferase [Polyangiaceae bacterium]